MFISTDITGALSANMYAYCENNPVNNSDPNGEVLSFLMGAALVGGVVGVATQLVSNVIFGSEHWYDGLAGAFVGGATYNLVSVATDGNVAAAGYAAAAAESITNEAISYLGKNGKKLDKENVKQSAMKIAVDTVWNGSFYGATGKGADYLLPLPYQPRMFTGVAAKRFVSQTVKQAEIYLASKVLFEAMVS